MIYGNCMAACRRTAAGIPAAGFSIASRTDLRNGDKILTTAMEIYYYECVMKEYIGGLFWLA